jgi:hypothetical protein
MVSEFAPPCIWGKKECLKFGNEVDPTGVIAHRVQVRPASVQGETQIRGKWEDGLLSGAIVPFERGLIECGIRLL